MPDAIIGEMPKMTDSALRSLLGLIRLSFRFDPEKKVWVCPDRTFLRSAIETESGLSGQGTRNGLEELEELGYVSIDRSGRSHEHALEIGVPTSRYTYVPTGLLEAPSLLGTDLRLILAALRTTWGWTTNPAETSSTEQTGSTKRGAPPEHDRLQHKRWAQLSTAALAQLTGRSETAVKEAARRLNGTWLQRRRPTSGAYYYRFRSEVLSEAALEEATETAAARAEAANVEATKAVSTGSEERYLRVKKKTDAVFSMGIPNDLAPDRQQSDSPHRGTIESSSKRSAKQCARFKQTAADEKGPHFPRRDSAVLGSGNRPPGSTKKPAQSPQTRQTRPKQNPHRGPEERCIQNNQVSLTGFSDQKQELGQKLANAGIWPSAIPELLGRFSAGRIEANFELFRKRAPQVQNQGAWLRTAIEEGYALPSSVSSLEETSSEETPSVRGSDGDRKNGNSPSKSVPEPGTKVSETRRRELIRRGLATEADFERFAYYDDPTELQHFFQIEKAPSPASRR
jgi:hypothetical protein